jgi:glucosylceramidase
VVDTSKTYQTMEGAGASLTDSAAWLMKEKMDGSQRSALFNDLFGMSGANLNYIRLPLSSSDIATADFTHDDQEYPNTDPKLLDFELNQNHSYSIPILHAMKKANPKVKLVGSAWSAPGWMKSGNSGPVRKGLINGTLADDYVDIYASYLTKLINAYEIRDIPFDAITM